MVTSANINQRHLTGSYPYRQCWINDVEALIETGPVMHLYLRLAIFPRSVFVSHIDGMFSLI